MNETDILEELGMSKSEASIYIALLETGSALAGKIIKKTGFHRGTTYQILQRLIEKGFVSAIVKGKKQHFQAVHPERFSQILKERKERFEEVLPKLKAKHESSKEKQDVTVYHGIEGIKAVMENILDELNPNGEYYDFGVSGLFFDVMKPYWMLWQKKKKRYKIKSYVIFNESIKKKNPYLIEQYYGKKRFHKKEFQSMTDTIIYDDNVILIIWTAKPPIAVVIKNKDNALSYRNQFKIMWKNAILVNDL